MTTSELLERRFDKALLYSIIIHIIDDEEETIYNKCLSIAAVIEKKAKCGEHPDFNYLAGSSTVDKLATESFNIWVAEYGIAGTQLSTIEREELRQWIAAKIFHILEDEFNGLIDDVYGSANEEIKKITHSPYYNTSDFYHVYKAFVPIMPSKKPDLCSTKDR